MKRTQSSLILSSLVAGFLFSAGLLFSQQQSIGICVDWVGDNQYDLIVSDYNEVDFFQFTLAWDAEVASFIEARGYADLHVDFNDWDEDFLADGLMSVIHLRPGVEGVTLEDGTVIMSIFLDTEDPLASLPYISDDILSIEVGRLDDEVFNFINEGENCSNIDRAHLSGRVTQSVSLDCADSDIVGVPHTIVSIQGSERTYYTQTHADGYYYAFLPEGTYTIEVAMDSTLYTQCTTLDIITVASTEDRIVRDFRIAPLRLCSDLEVSVATSRLRSCVTSRYFVKYQNAGTVTANNPEIVLELPEGLHDFASEVAYTALGGGKYAISLDDLAPREGGQFTFTCKVDCDELDPLTYCVSAAISPGVECQDIDPRWSGARLVVDADCDGDQVIFNVSNQGDSRTSSPRHVVIIRNDAAYDEDELELSAGESHTYRIDADGATYRIIVDQEKYHPGISEPTIAIEACGSGEADFGYITQFNEDDANKYVDIFCLQAVNSYDPNDKLAQPAGIGTQGFIPKNKPIDYTIRFQNTGTDTAYLVIIRDTIDELLNPATIRGVISSHDMDFHLSGEDQVTFTFRDIDLVDSTTNEAASHGFVKFTIDPIKDLEIGSSFSNHASIYFDRNPAIVTNQVRHTISQDFIRVLTATVDQSDESYVKIFPNPASTTDAISIDISDTEMYDYSLYDMTGTIITGGTKTDRIINLTDHALLPGLYVLRVQLENRNPYITKLIIK